MSKTKSKSHETELQYLRKQVRELTKLCRQQERKLTKYQKQDHFYNDIKDEVEELVAIKEEAATKKDLQVPCDVCYEGHYENLLDILDKLYGSCSHCGHRKRLK